MKQIDYRTIVIIIIIVATTAIGFKLFLPFHSNTNPAITVNQKIISKADFNEMYSKKSGFQSYSTFIDSVVVREVLVQEAIKSGIPKEPAFQKAIKDFYEQSLVKLLMDRKYRTLNPEVSEASINRFMELSNTIVNMTLITGTSKNDFESRRNLNSESITVRFIDLSTDVKYALLSLKPGQTTPPEFSEKDQQFSAIRLDSLEKSDMPQAYSPDRAEIKKLLSEFQKEQLLSQWIETLKNTATVTISTGTP